jgi:hypothetical protein
MSRRIIITGDSHIAALMNGVEHFGKDLADRIIFHPLGGANIAPLDFFEVDKEAKRVRVNHPKWIKTGFPSKDIEGHIYWKAQYAISMPCNSTRFIRDYDWSRFVPWHLRQSPDEIALSDQAIRRMMVADIKSSLLFMRALQELGLDICAIEAPRHFAHAPQMEAIRPEVAKWLGEAYVDFAVKALSDMEVPLIRIPENSVGPDGAMLPEHKSRKKTDSLHANMEFGMEMVRRIVAYADRKR